MGSTELLQLLFSSAAISGGLITIGGLITNNRLIRQQKRDKMNNSFIEYAAFAELYFTRLYVCELHKIDYKDLILKQESAFFYSKHKKNINEKITFLQNCIINVNNYINTNEKLIHSISIGNKEDIQEIINETGIYEDFTKQKKEIYNLL